MRETLEAAAKRSIEICGLQIGPRFVRVAVGDGDERQLRAFAVRGERQTSERAYAFAVLSIVADRRRRRSPTVAADKRRRRSDRLSGGRRRCPLLERRRGSPRFSAARLLRANARTLSRRCTRARARCVSPPRSPQPPPLQ